MWALKLKYRMRPATTIKAYEAWYYVRELEPAMRTVWHYEINKAAKFATRNDCLAVLARLHIINPKRYHSLRKGCSVIEVE